MRFAYADPPYIGQAQKHYGCEEIPSLDIYKRLWEYDGWAWSCSSPTLFQVMQAIPFDVRPKTRLGAWVKPFASFKANVNPGYAWEPVVFWGGRRLGRDIPTVVDWVSANITLETGTHGAKPESFCFWIFQMLGMQLGDEFDDLFVGSGAVTNAWQRWCSQMVLL